MSSNRRSEKFIDFRDERNIVEPYPDSVKSYEVLDWFSRRNEVLEDNELIYDNIHAGYRGKKPKLKRGVLHSHARISQIQYYSMHDAIHQNNSRKYTKKHAHHKVNNDPLFNIQPLSSRRIRRK